MTQVPISRPAPRLWPRLSRKVQKEEDGKTAKTREKKEGKGKESEGEQRNQTKATIKSPKAKATSNLKAKAAEKGEGSTKKKSMAKNRRMRRRMHNYAYQSHYQWLQGKQKEPMFVKQLNQLETGRSRSCRGPRILLIPSC